MIRLPISYSQRRKNQMGRGYVPCIVSERWLQFPKVSDGYVGDGEVISISVMTNGQDDRPHRLCDLMITREDLLRAVGAVRRRDEAEE